MRGLIERVVVAATATVFVVALVQSQPSAVAFAGILAFAAAALLTVRYAAILLRIAELRIGHRSRTHREVLSLAPSPRHPNTRGRTRSRAPALVLAAA